MRNLLIILSGQSPGSELVPGINQSIILRPFLLPRFIKIEVSQVLVNNTPFNPSPLLVD